MNTTRKIFGLASLPVLCALAHTSAPVTSDAQATAPEAAPNAEKIEANGDYGGYYTWPEVSAKIAEWKAKHPALITQSSLGTTVEGREIPLLKITDGAAKPEAARPESLFLFGVHPREQAPTIAMVRFIDELLEGHGKDARITKLLGSHVVWIVPMLNVDGKVHDMAHGNGTTRGADWRKNRRANPDGTVGVDLNRNFPVRWGGSRMLNKSWNSYTTRTSSDIYEGPAPGSEPEAQALMDFVSSRPLRLMVDIHSPLHTLLAPTYLIAPEHARFQRLLRGIQAAQAKPYPIGNLNGSFVPGTEPPPGARGGDSGISYTWSYYTQGITSFNIEMGQPGVRGARARYEPPASIETDYKDNIRGPLLYLLEESGALPLRKDGASTCKGGTLDKKLVPGAKVTWTPKIEGRCDYAVLQPTRPEVVVNSEYRLAPLKHGFEVEVAADAKPGTIVPLKLYLWTKGHERSVCDISLKVEAP